MALELYPTSVDPLIGYSVEPIYYTQRTPTKSGADVAEKLWDTPRFRIRMQYRVSEVDAREIFNFHHEMRGSYQKFDFIDLHSRTSWEDVYVGVGDGSTRDFDCDVSTSAATVYVDGVAQTPITDFTFGSGTGDNGRDQILFTVGGTPPDGDVITMDGSGNRFYAVRFENDSLPYRTLPQFTDGVERLEFQVVLISQR